MSEVGIPTARITVVICTKDRAVSLAATLEKYLPLWDAPAWSLVLVDDGSRDETARLIAGLQRRYGDRVQVVRTAGVGLGAARNEGWRLADGELVLFTDDDCYPGPNLFGEIRRYFAATNRDFLGGRLLPFSPGDAAVAVVTRESPTMLAGVQFVPAGLLPGANLTVRRGALEAVGGFDPEFGAGTPFPAEDVDLVARLLAAGFTGGYDPGPIVLHHHGRETTASQRALLRSYDRGRGAYYAKCLGNPILRTHYVRAWAERARRGSWAGTCREVAGAWRYWTRPRPRPTR